jgi:hypothetical protein
MTSNKQLKANRKNSLLGGVKTTKGKEISKYNALTHGILRQSLTDYESDFYIDIYNELIGQFNPVGVMERVLIERVAIYYLKLFRVQKAETEFMKANLNPRVVKKRDLIQIVTDKMFDDEVVNEGYYPVITNEVVVKISETFGRYEGTIENRLYRALHELQWLQKNRGVDPSFQMGSFGKNSI